MKSVVVEVGVQVMSPLRFDYALSSADETSSEIEYGSRACRRRCAA